LGGCIGVGEAISLELLHSQIDQMQAAATLAGADHGNHRAPATAAAS
jgi:hypothetical protein